MALPVFVYNLCSVRFNLTFAAAKKKLHSEKFKETLRIHTGKKLGRDERSSRQKLLETGLMR